METKLCRICGKLGQNYVQIFKTEGLKNKIETCLPIIVSPHSLLPDTICTECSENVNNYYSFIKNCLQNIIILEAQYDITESCLKTKRKHDKSCLTDRTFKKDKHIQTDDYLDILIKENEDFQANFPQFLPQPIECKPNLKLVDYEVDSDTNSECESTIFRKQYFDDAENYLINEITQRKNLKRKSDFIIESRCPKIFKIDSSSRRKNKQPKKVEHRELDGLDNSVPLINHEQIVQSDKCDLIEMPQVCLLCEEQFSKAAVLASHVYEIHGIDMAQVLNAPVDNLVDKKKKLPNLLKISDLRKNEAVSEEPQQQIVDHQRSEDPPTLFPSFVCPLCPGVFTARPDLFNHLRVKHPEKSSLLCGMCLHQSNSSINLKSHVDQCYQHHQPSTKYYCSICRFGDDNTKVLENHVIVHDFLLESCKKQSRIFDPADYVSMNENIEQVNNKLLQCSDCNQDDFESFKEFSAHRRNHHSIFHCDLCNKFYGRNSHLWKHVNRLHKGHPSITCQVCYKTSASKYHLAQHFNKIHTSKPIKQKIISEPVQSVESNDDFMSQKFQAFDFQSVKQSFMRQELIDKLDKNKKSSEDNNSVQSDQLVEEPKEIDSTSDLYTNIITNYTPPVNEGEFKCPKCGKGFHKKTLLKKHKKNCRPRLQKDLLTRCKSCARIFKDRQSLAKHLINYHSEYQCEICQQKVQSKCEIVSHIRFSHPGCHLFCSLCGNILRNRDDLNEHSRDHSNSYICQFCADPLPSKIKLKMHILSLHRKILSLSCGVCLKLFETQHVLRDHVRLAHRDQLAPLTSCPVCGKNYGSKWKTYDHLNKSHGRIFKACKACLEVFDTDAQLQGHYDKFHSNSNSNSAPIKILPAAIQNQINNIDNVENNNSENSDNSDDNEMAQVKKVTINDGQISLSIKKNNSQMAPQLISNKIITTSTDQEMAPISTMKKYSLLEKRLLGKKIQQSDDQDVIINTNNKLVNNNKSSENSSDAANIPLANSSKRTVYVNSNDPSFCEICLKTWPAKKHLWQHYIRCHKSVAATVCGICLKTNSDYATLQRHLVETHPTLLHGQGFGSNFICRICGRYHNASSKLKLHMAIHENFDWTLLDRKSEKIDDDRNNGNVDNDDEDDDINYESLIEQVECSSASESDDNNEKNRSSSSSNDDDNDDDDDDEDDNDDDNIIEEDNSDSDMSMEAQMLQNMLQERTQSIIDDDIVMKEELIIKDDDDNDSDDSNSSFSGVIDDRKSDIDDIKSDIDYTKSETDDIKSDIDDIKSDVDDIDDDDFNNDDDDDDEASCASKSTIDSTDNDKPIVDDFVKREEQEPEELLDSAIRSIKYECVEQINDDNDDDYCDMQLTNLNDNEIESAVGSIL